MLRALSYSCRESVFTGATGTVISFSESRVRHFRAGKSVATQPHHSSNRQRTQGRSEKVSELESHTPLDQHKGEVYITYCNENLKLKAIYFNLPRPVHHHHPSG